jgi:hypothetical protein
MPDDCDDDEGDEEERLTPNAGPFLARCQC